MPIRRAGSQPSQTGPAANFTGAVRRDPLYEAPPPGRVMSVLVTFEPGARTFWHTHPLGQTLHIVSGVGHVQTWGGPIRQVRAGDTVWIPPGEKHWHGATPEHGMEHLAMQEAQGGEHVSWMEPVTDEQYKARPAG
jgi:quercetin dioxygenase-like cupin family protein